jgi:hypothetical protein
MDIVLCFSQVYSGNQEQKSTAERFEKHEI